MEAFGCFGIGQVISHFFPIIAFRLNNSLAFVAFFEAALGAFGVASDFDFFVGISPKTWSRKCQHETAHNSAEEHSCSFHNRCLIAVPFIWTPNK